MKICFLGGGNAHALTCARYFAALGHDCFGIGRAHPKPRPLWLTPPGYRYYRSHLWIDWPAPIAITDDEKPDIVISFAAQGESASSFGPDSWRYYQTNAAMMARLVDAMVFGHFTHVPRLFIQVSTSELYGSTPTPATEDSPVRPTSPYALSKATFDAHLQLMHRAHNFPAIIVRPSNCYTAGQQLHRVVPRAAIATVYGRQMELRGGSAEKTYLDTEDLARALETLIERGKAGHVYNVGADAPYRIDQLVAAVAAADRVGGAKLLTDIAHFVEPRFGEDSCYALNSSKIKALGWAPKVKPYEGIERMIEWARSFPELAHVPLDQPYEVSP